MGHLATRQCNKTLLEDEHTVTALADEPVLPAAERGADEDSESEDGETDSENHDLTGNLDLDDADLADMAGFAAL